MNREKNYEIIHKLMHYFISWRHDDAFSFDDILRKEKFDPITINNIFIKWSKTTPQQFRQLLHTQISRSNVKIQSKEWLNNISGKELNQNNHTSLPVRLTGIHPAIWGSQGEKLVIHYNV